MSKVRDKSPVAGDAAEFTVRAERLGRPPLPWTWSIYKAGDGIAYERGELFYRSAEDAWMAGNAVLQQTRRSTGQSS